MYRPGRKDQELVNKPHLPAASNYDIASWILAGVALFLVLRLGLLPALIGGLR